MTVLPIRWSSLKTLNWHLENSLFKQRRSMMLQLGELAASEKNNVKQ